MRCPARRDDLLISCICSSIDSIDSIDPIDPIDSIDSIDSIAAEHRRSREMTTQSNQRSGDELTAAGQQARGARTIPDRAQVIVVGGGIIGTSVAYHLAHMGMKDVLLLERDRLTSGTT